MNRIKNFRELYAIKYLILMFMQLNCIERDKYSIPISIWGLDPQFNIFKLVLIGNLKNFLITKISTNFNHYEFYYMNRAFNKVEICGIIINKKSSKYRCETFFLKIYTNLTCLILEYFSNVDSR